MPFINTKVNISISKEQEKELKTRLGKAISMLPGKSEQWLMTGFEDNCHLYFRGDDSDPIAFVDVKVYGGGDSAAFSKLTGAITDIYGDVIGIAPDHIYVAYQPTDNWGWNGSNF